MPKTISQYSIFIGSPGGLSKERKRFRASLEKCSLHHGLEKGAIFHPVGWEDTIGGAGRPQALINDDLRQCDYAVFVLHDRWGSPTGGGHSSGTEEEWYLAEELYRANKIRNIALFFKQVDPGKLADAGDQLKPVLAFKKKIEEGKRYLFKQYRTLDEFADALEGHLALWLKEHEKVETAVSSNDQVSAASAVDYSRFSPPFDYWMAEAKKIAAKDNAGALFCASKAVDAAKSDIERGRANISWGVAQLACGNVDEALAAFSATAELFVSCSDGERGRWRAQALVNKGITFRTLDRSQDEISIYDEVLAQFGGTTEPAVRAQVAKALSCKGAALSKLGRNNEVISVYDNLLARFGDSKEMELRERVARALFGKGHALGQLHRTEDAIVVYDDVLTRFGAASELQLREQVARASTNKGFLLGRLGRYDAALSVYDDVLVRLGEAVEPSMRELAAKVTRLKAELLESQELSRKRPPKQ